MPFDFDLIVIGGGAAGLSASGFGATLGARCMMVERNLLGGDCTWTGCIPSKTLLHAARLAALDAGARPFAEVMGHVRLVRRRVYEEADAPEIYERMGITVAKGSARFVDEHTVEITGENDVRRVTARFFLIATGARAGLPAVEGLAAAPVLTNETLFELSELPAHMAVVGAGPVGVEAAQAFARLGCNVTVVEQEDRILPRDDPESAAVVAAALVDDGVRLELGAAVERIEAGAAGDAAIVAGAFRGRFDAILIAAGRVPNVETLGLDRAGVSHSPAGITVNRSGRTSVRHIYASGDVTGRYRFTHMSEHMSKVAVTNMLLRLPARFDDANVPWVTFTDPELAHVGRSARQLDDAGIRFRTYRFPHSRIDRAITEGRTNGHIKVYARERDGRIYGADVVGAAAGEIISEFAVAMRNRISLRRMSDTIHPYPTYGLGARRVADQWYVQKYSPKLVRLLQRVFRYRGAILDIGPDDVI